MPSVRVWPSGLPAFKASIIKGEGDVFAFASFTHSLNHSRAVTGAIQE